MAASRSSLEFLRRSGISVEDVRPRPRLDLDVLLVHTVPMAEPPLPAAGILRQLEGMPPPDRNLSRPWPREP